MTFESFSDMGLLNLEALTSQLNMNAGFGCHPGNDLAATSSGSRHDSGGLGNGYGGLLSNHHLPNGMQQGLGLGMKNESQVRPNSFLLEKQHQQQSLSKDWQDGLRALLPNVNVSFGALPHGPSNGTDGRGGMYSQQSSMMNDHHHQQHERMQRQQQQQQHSRSGEFNTNHSKMEFHN